MTSPYRLVKGSDKNLAAFEAEISKALAEGYDLANDLVVQHKPGAGGDSETLLFQSLINDDALEYEEEDDEDLEDEEDEDEA